MYTPPEHSFLGYAVVTPTEIIEVDDVGKVIFKKPGEPTTYPVPHHFLLEIRRKEDGSLYGEFKWLEPPYYTERLQETFKTQDLVFNPKGEFSFDSMTGAFRFEFDRESGFYKGLFEDYLACALELSLPTGFYSLVNE